jgi:hypothetical protein
VFLLPATRHCSLFAPLLFIFADEFLMVLSTSDSSYDVGTNLARSLRISDPKNYDFLVNPIFAFLCLCYIFLSQAWVPSVNPCGCNLQFIKVTVRYCIGKNVFESPCCIAQFISTGLYQQCLVKMRWVYICIFQVVSQNAVVGISNAIPQNPCSPIPYRISRFA